MASKSISMIFLRHSTTPSALRPIIRPARRYLQKASSPFPRPPNFAFAFDIDGVLCRSQSVLPGASRALRTLRANQIPFILLTNGGGTSESARAAQLSNILETPISITQFIQSHTPFSEFPHLSDKTALVLGGPEDGHSCREVAMGYGFGNVVTPMDVYAAYPDIWPMGMEKDRIRKEVVRPLPKPLAFEVTGDMSPEKFLKIDAAFVFNDPRDWSTDTTVLLDTLLSYQGYLGTLSPKNGEKGAKNSGYLQDGQPPVYFSNPDVWWAAKWKNPRLGQGAFRAAFEGVFKAATDGAELLHVEQWGKPYQTTYEFAEKRLARQREELLGDYEGTFKGLKKVYMVGDNPESDIRGANSFKSSTDSEWRSILVRSGVYNGGEPTAKPKAIVDGVWEAVQHAFKENSFTPKEI